MHTILRSSIWIARKGVHSLPEPMRAPGLLTGQLRTTTILCIRKGNEVVMMGDKRVTLGQSIIAKDSARKLRRAGSYSSVADSEKDATTEQKVDKYSDPSTVLVGFAGSTADAMTLLEKLEAKLNEFPAQLLRASVELAKEWRGDKMLRRLEASMIVADVNETLEIDGSGNVLTPDSSTSTDGQDEGIVAIGSGGQYAKSAARALMKFVKVDEASSNKEQSTKWSAEMICRASMEVAAGIDVFTSKQFDVDRLHIPPPHQVREATGEEKATTQEEKPQETAEKAVKPEPLEKGLNKESVQEEVEPKNIGKAANSDVKNDQKPAKSRATAAKNEENVSKSDEKAKKTAGKNQQHKKGKEE